MLIWTLLGILLISLIITYATNPFTRLSIVKRPFKVSINNDILTISDKNAKLKVYQNRIWRWFAIYQCGIYILTTRYIHQPPSKQKDISGIISSIHKLRFNPKKLLVISGDHFNALFVRNLGVFYYPILDSSIPSSKEDWQHRETVYLQTVAYALGIFAKHDELTTTIVAMGRYAATCVNFYSYPSDSMFGILYALASLSGVEKSRSHDYNKPIHELDTIPAAKQLISDYKDTLIRHYNRYSAKVFDDKANLIFTNIHLSGAKDITRRHGAFYDNVIYWKTTQLAMKLGLIQKDYKRLADLKQNILKTFWHKKGGHFLEDMSKEGLDNNYYSSDWLIVLSTGFLNPLDKSEIGYFTESINYITKNDIDKPFAIKYQQSTRAHRQFMAVRLAVSSYGGDAIWSFWGMEYIKALILVYKQTGDITYAQIAKQHLKAYRSAMERERGFPEVYDRNGKILQTLFYRSILQTGWVIGFEQAAHMYKSIVKKL